MFPYTVIKGFYECYSRIIILYVTSAPKKVDNLI